MYITRHNIANLYESRLIREMDERIIDYLNDNKEDLPFEHIFKNKLRIIIPIISDPMANNILNTLKRIKDYGGVDLDSGEVIRKIKIDPQYGGGEKDQRIKLGSAIAKLKISEEDKQQYLDWLALYKDNLKDTLTESKFVIVLSRAPVDVIKMSELDSIDSSNCHRMGNQYFQCAVQEAINGGAVAFLIGRSELEEHLNDGFGLQDDELMDDSDRGINGISPLARLRVRRLVSTKDNTEFAVPDVKIYGEQNIPGFYQTLKSFIKPYQPMDTDKFSLYDWEKRGGTYYDGGYSISRLIHSYFDESFFPDEIPHNKVDKRDQESRKRDIHQYLNTLETECAELKRTANIDLTYCRVDFEYVNDDEPYVLPYGDCEYSFENMNNTNINNVEVEFEGSDILSKILEGHFDEEIIWSRFFEWLFEDQRFHLQKFQISNGVMSFEFKDKDDEVYFNSNEYDRFLDIIEDFDNQLDRIDDDEWNDIFKEIVLVQNDALEYLIANTSDDISYDNSRGNRHVEWVIPIDAITGETFSTYTDKTSFTGIPNIRDRAFIGDNFATMIDNYIRLEYKLPASNSYQQTFNNFYESYYQPVMKGDNALRQYNIDSMQINVEPNTTINYRSGMGKNVTIMFNIKLNVESFDEENTKLIVWLNNHLDDLKNMVRLAYLSENRYIRTKSPKYKNLFNNLKQVYGKYA